MAYTSEIEKLERRWKENPQGTVFAPLAEVYRKDGQLERAREVLRQGLENNPDHIPGNIVLGRCCLDLHEDGAAEAAFGHVLQLDSENVIALKALGEITERQGRLAEAGQWLNRLVEVDPSNDDARDQLARVDAVREAEAGMLLRSIPISDSVAPAVTAPPAEAEVQAEAPTAFDVESPEYSFPVAAEIFSPGWDEPSAVFTPPPVEAAPSPVGDAVSPPRAPEQVFAEAETQPILDVISPLELDRSPSPFVEFEESDPAPASTVGGLESVEFDLGFAAEAVTQELPGIELLETSSAADFDIPTLLTPLSESFVVPNEEVPAIELRSIGSSEFQGPDHGNDLLTVQPAGFSEFQVPDAAADLGMRGSATNEFQLPSGSEELLNASAGGSEFQSVADAASELAAAMTESEFQSVAPPAIDIPDELVLITEAAGTLEPLEMDEPVEAAESVEAVELEPVDLEEAAEPVEALKLVEPADTAAPVEAVEPSSVVSSADTANTVEERGEIVTSEYAAISASMVEVAPPIEPGMADEWTMVQAGGEPSAEEPEIPPGGRLPLIFPDDAERAEPARPRRLSQVEPAAFTDREGMEPGVGEPEPILTETMAELYAQQGHREEALRVYRILVERSPGDERLGQRVRALEQEAQTEHSGGSRRAAYAASATGGESVESFFRALVSARPGPNGEPAGAEPSASAGDKRGQGAPTRPASDPLSLSAIFGEESAQMPASPAPPQPVPEPGPLGGDAFSFDQFFGAKSPQSGAAQPPGRVTHPAGLEEDLDQFQNWLKSLKK